MPEVNIPIDGPTLQNVDESALKNNATRIFDGFIDELGALNKRPGSTEFVDSGLGAGKVCCGNFWWEQKKIAISVIDGVVYKISYPSGLPTITNLAGVALNPATPASFATDGNYLFIANGGKIAYTDGSTAPAFISDADAPINVSHVACLDGYLIANKADSNQWYWANLETPLNWSALNFASGAGNADYNDALHVAWREIYLFGKTSIEVWENDGSTPFSRVPGGYIEHGCGARYSIIRAGESLWWLDRNRRLLQMAHDRSPRVVSTPYDKTLQGFQTIEDCQGSAMNIAGKSFLIFTFPTENRTIVMEQSDGRLYEWGCWNSTLGLYDAWVGRFPIYCPEWGFHLSGNSVTANILRWSTSSYSDSGAEIRPAIRTGWIDEGSSKTKRSNELRLRLKRGSVTTSPRASAIMRWRNDGQDSWGVDHNIDLGDVGESEHYAVLYRTGMYRSRQYELYITDNCPVTIVEVKHEVDYLR